LIFSGHAFADGPGSGRDSGLRGLHDEGEAI
jgi:hypothetical protein